MQTAKPRGLQYGVREILMFVFGIAFIIGLSRWFWMNVTHSDDVSRSIYAFIFAFLSGCIFYLIGWSMRNRTPERKLHIYSFTFVFVMLVFSTALFSYCVWASSHIEQDIIDGFKGDRYYKFVHGWPYPDLAIAFFCERFDIALYRGPVNEYDITPHPRCVIQLTYAPLMGIIGWCLGMLMPIGIGKKSAQNDSA
jgi:hypothetical protein